MKIDIPGLTRSFSPKIRYVEVSHYFDLSSQKEIKSDELYLKIEELTQKAYPSFKDKFDTKWEDVYLPMKRKGRLLSLPFSIGLYESVYYVFFHGFRGFGCLAVSKGNDKYYDERYCLFIEESVRFIPVLKEYGVKLIERTFPYDLREGKIKGKYTTDNVMSEKKRKGIETAYKKHIEKKLTVSEISLNDYLETAAICYRAANKKETRQLTPLEMYKKWADSRHGGMLDIKDPDSKEEYTEWRHSGKWAGQHPFEIVYSFFGLGVHLHPPGKHRSSFSLSNSNELLVEVFVCMAEALMKHNIPFEASRLDEALDYLTGESYLRVNQVGLDSFCYEPSRENRKKYFPHILWDEIKIVKWK